MLSHSAPSARRSRRSGPDRSIRPLVALFAASLATLIVLTLRRPVLFTQDDSVFYLVIAENIVDGRGITFSTLVPTNGFQPLWLAVVTATVATASAVGLTSDVALLRAVSLVSWLLVLSTLAVFDRVLRSLGCAAVARAVAAATILAFFGGAVGTLGSEAALVALVLVGATGVAIAILRGPHRTSAATTGAFGLLLGLLVLARVDTAAVALALLAAVRWGPRATCRAADGDRSDPIDPRTTVVVGAAGVASLVVVPYLVWNVVAFGNLLPISAVLKVDLTDPGFTASAVAPGGRGLLVIAVIVGAVGVVRRPAGDPARPIWLALTGGAAAGSLIVTVGSTGGLTSWYWYYVPHCIAAATAVALAVDRVTARRPAAIGAEWRFRTVRAATVIAGAAVLVAAVGIDARRPTTAGARELYGTLAFAAALRGALPPGAPVATVDLPGFLALIGDRPVLALDGLTGDFRFQRDLVADGVDCVLERLEVHHVVTYGDRPGRRSTRSGARVLPVVAPLSGRSAGSLSLRAPPLSSVSSSPLRLWRVQPTCDEPTAT